MSFREGNGCSFGTASGTVSGYAVLFAARSGDTKAIEFASSACSRYLKAAKLTGVHSSNEARSNGMRSTTYNSGAFFAVDFFVAIRHHLSVSVAMPLENA